VDAHLATYNASGTVSGIDDRSIIAILVGAVKDLAKKFNDLAATVASFADKFTTKELTFDRAHGTDLTLSHELCIGQTCVTEDQLKAMLAASAAASAPGSGASNTGAPAAVPEGGTDGPPIIAINGGNPATISVGATYVDLGVTITGPQADLNLGIHTFVDGIATDLIVIDTSGPSSHIIEYVVSDSTGLTSTTTRTVIVQAANDNPPLLQATGTDATTTAQ
jgi:Domain of unknown function (DUF5011)